MAKEPKKCCECKQATIDWYPYSGTFYCKPCYEDTVRRDSRVRLDTPIADLQEQIADKDLFWWDENSNGRLMEQCKLIMRRATGSIKKRMKTEVDYWREKAKESELQGCYEASDECRRALWKFVHKHFSGPPKE